MRRIWRALRYLCQRILGEIDTTKAYVNRVLKKNDSVVNNTFVKMMEALGYDIELHYIERKDKE